MVFIAKFLLPRLLLFFQCLAGTFLLVVIDGWVGTLGKLRLGKPSGLTP